MRWPYTPQVMDAATAHRYLFMICIYLYYLAISRIYASGVGDGYLGDEWSLEAGTTSVHSLPADRSGGWMFVTHTVQSCDQKLLIYNIAAILIISIYKVSEYLCKKLQLTGKI